jgi:hypothetical protein
VATFSAQVGPAHDAGIRQRLIPQPRTTRILVWRCDDRNCDYNEVFRPQSNRQPAIHSAPRVH